MKYSYKVVYLVREKPLSLTEFLNEWASKGYRVVSVFIEIWGTTQVPIVVLESVVPTN